MKAQRGLSINKEVLKDKVPLDTPYLLYVFPIYACNFKCSYCLHSLQDKAYNFERNTLDIHQYKKRIDELKYFSSKIKLIRFAGMGEPLLHKDIAEMVSYAKKANVANEVDIITNGSLLDKSMSDKLIDAGVDRLKISVQAITDLDYMKMTGVDIDLDQYIMRLKYFYENKKDTKVYIKIVDAALKNRQDEKKFYEMFGDVCDEIAIEHIYPATKDIEYKKFSGFEEGKKTVLGYEYEELSVCPQPFYTVTLEPDNSVGFCCAYDSCGIVKLPNIQKKNLFKVWNSKEHIEFLVKMLDGVESVCENCSQCTTFKYAGIHENDKLDGMKKSIRNRLKTIHVEDDE